MRLNVGPVEAADDAQHLAQVRLVPVDPEQRHSLQNSKASSDVDSRAGLNTLQSGNVACLGIRA